MVSPRRRRDVWCFGCGLCSRSRACRSAERRRRTSSADQDDQRADPSHGRADDEHHAGRAGAGKSAGDVLEGHRPNDVGGLHSDVGLADRAWRSGEGGVHSGLVEADAATGAVEFGAAERDEDRPGQESAAFQRQRVAAPGRSLGRRNGTDREEVRCATRRRTGWCQQPRCVCGTVCRRGRPPCGRGRPEAYQAGDGDREHRRG